MTFYEKMLKSHESQEKKRDIFASCDDLMQASECFDENKYVCQALPLKPEYSYMFFSQPHVVTVMR